LTKDICLTFDYELFFGDSGTVDNCLLNPTDKILDVLRNNGQKANFFIDVLYLERLKAVQREQSNFGIILDQLARLVDSGHRIELHLHPHWLDARYEDGRWIFPHYDHYTLQSFPEAAITDLFVRGTQFLEEIAGRAKNGYKILAFRAGGWGIQPFAALKNGFAKAGIKIDSSVMPGLKDWGSIQSFDFSHAPSDLSFWRFSDDPCCVDDQGEFWEIPISAYRKSFLDRLSQFLYRRLCKDTPFGDGRPILPHDMPASSIISRLRTQQLSFLTTDDAGKRGILRHIKKDGNALFVFINHPKLMLRKSGLDNLRTCARFNAVLLKDVINRVKDR
jgi:peptidoglycan/xylan/chitin deacetylase (PgdA/CDA1 family)